METKGIGKKSKVTTIITTIVMLLVLGGCIGALSWSLTGLKKNDSLMDKQREQLVLDNEKMKQDIIRETKEDLIKDIKDKKLVEVVEVQDKVAEEMIEKKLENKSLVGKKMMFTGDSNTIEVDFKNNETLLFEFYHCGARSYAYLSKGGSEIKGVSYMFDPNAELHVIKYEVVWKENKAILTKKEAGYFKLSENNEYQTRIESASYCISAVYF